MRLVLLGIPGCGKSTQGNLLSHRLKIPYLSTGHIFRHMAKEKTTLGRYIKSAIASGKLVNDEKTIEIVNNYLSQKIYSKGYILDGFPRNIYQAKAFHQQVDKVIYLRITDKEALWRMAERDDEGRSDDRVAVVKDRIDLFHETTSPLINYFDSAGMLIEIDAERSIEEINDDILKNLGKEWIDRHLQNWQQKRKRLLLITGLPGAGKTEAEKYFLEKNIEVIRFSSFINQYIDDNKLEHDESTHARLREEFRSKHGMAAMAVISKTAIEKALSKNELVVISGWRSYDELEYLQKTFPDCIINSIAIWAPANIRYARVRSRATRNHLTGKIRDLNETLLLNMGPSLALADYMVINNKSLSELHDQLEDIYREIYFS